MSPRVDPPHLLPRVSVPAVVMALDHRAANIWIARIIPVILHGIIGYSSWVITKLVCVDYLIRPSSDIPQAPRPGTAIAVLVIYYMLLLPVLASYLRLLQTIVTNPNYIPRGPQWYEQQRDLQKEERQRQKGRRRRRSGNTKEKADQSSWEHDGEAGLGSIRSSDSERAAPHDVEKTKGLEPFYLRDVFICQHDGRPIWCSHCLNVKVDRAHHCSEVSRCLRKMDHFCPWVGGVVSETSFKWFIQFVSYAALFCCFTLVFMAIFVAELQRKYNRLNVHWILTLSFAALFGLFNLGMAGSSIQLALINSTTVENLSRKTKVWTLAIHIPSRILDSETWTSGATVTRYLTRTYPINPNKLPQSNDQTTTPEPTEGASCEPAAPSRTFAIISTAPGDNPFDLGSPLANMKEVMGYTLLEWLLPIKYSPCCDHTSMESAYKLGPVVQRLREQAGIPSDLLGDERIGVDGNRKRRHHHHRRRSSRSVADDHRREEGSRKGNRSMEMDDRKGKRKGKRQEEPERERDEDNGPVW